MLASIITKDIKGISSCLKLAPIHRSQTVGAENRACQHIDSVYFLHSSNEHAAWILAAFIINATKNDCKIVVSFYVLLALEGYLVTQTRR